VYGQEAARDDAEGAAGLLLSAAEIHTGVKKKIIGKRKREGGVRGS